MAAVFHCGTFAGLLKLLPFWDRGIPSKWLKFLIVAEFDLPPVKSQIIPGGNCEFAPVFLAERWIGSPLPAFEDIDDIAGLRNFECGGRANWLQGDQGHIDLGCPIAGGNAAASYPAMGFSSDVKHGNFGCDIL